MSARRQRPIRFLTIYKLLNFVQARSQKQLFLGDKGIYLWGGGNFFGGGQPLTLLWISLMIVAKMVFVRYFGGSKNLRGRQLPSDLSIRVYVPELR